MSVAMNDEFTVPDNYTMDDIKRRVMSWNASYLGKEYIMEVKSERHIILTKSKHDMRICCYPCIALLVGIPVLFLFAGASPYFAFFGIFAYLGLVIVVEVIAVYLFCLKPKKAEYSITFSHDMPIRVRVIGTGEIEASAHEYKALKDSLYGGRKIDSGPVISDDVRPDAGFQTICPYCGARNEQGVLKCHKCGADI